ncbi:kinase-like domain-containing protein [Paraphysoderma sedebokerense]|nr:kinase-like domain-containing protein [Paraphysoderma sedebokerense]
MISDLLFEGQILKDEKFEVKVGQVIGLGGCSDVFVGYEMKDGKETGQLFALKAEQLSFKYRCSVENEYELWSMMQEDPAVDGVISMKHFFKLPEVYVLVLELLDGSLFELMEIFGGRLPVRMVRSIAIQLIRTLQKVHGKGILHRDLKTGNLLYSLRDTLKIVIADFGLGATMEEDRKDYYAGTNAYQSLAAHHGYAQYAEDDLFSLAIVFIELIMGDLPFPYLAKDKDARLTTEQYLQAKEYLPKLWHKLPMNIPGELKAFYEGMLQRIKTDNPPPLDYEELVELFEMADKLDKTSPPLVTMPSQIRASSMSSVQAASPVEGRDEFIIQSAKNPNYPTHISSRPSSTGLLQKLSSEAIVNTPTNAKLEPQLVASPTLPSQDDKNCYPRIPKSFSIPTYLSKACEFGVTKSMSLPALSSYLIATVQMNTNFIVAETLIDNASTPKDVVVAVTNNEMQDGAMSTNNAPCSASSIPSTDATVCSTEKLGNTEDSPTDAVQPCITENTDDDSKQSATTELKGRKPKRPKLFKKMARQLKKFKKMVTSCFKPMTTED